MGLKEGFCGGACPQIPLLLFDKSNCAVFVVQSLAPVIVTECVLTHTHTHMTMKIHKHQLCGYGCVAGLL